MHIDAHSYSYEMHTNIDQIIIIIIIIRMMMMTMMETNALYIVKNLKIMSLTFNCK